MFEDVKPEIAPAVADDNISLPYFVAFKDV
jgi:hypothetical protein